MANSLILVTGANGQLGKELQALAAALPAWSFHFAGRGELPIQDADRVAELFTRLRPAWCVNCAAYTAVDKAESDHQNAFAVNATGPALLAAACRRAGTRFIHISTDYVFDGASPQPYRETDATNPISVYGASKLKGEQLCMQENPESIIIRTAWVYSAFGHNFVKTMMRLMKERSEIGVVNDQVGAPTYAADLARCILDIIAKNTWSGASWQPGIYHFSNEGRISWYEFAVAIKELTGSACMVKPIVTSQYPTPARRPAFSLLDTQKIQQTFGCRIPEWKDGLVRCLEKLRDVKQ